MRPSKREELIRGALLIFYNEGFHATGMDRVAAETGVSKTAIYKHFRTKEDLILATLRLRDETFRYWFFSRMEKLSPEPLGQLLAMFDALEEWFETDDFQGCMFVKAASEFQNISHPIHQQSAEHKRLLERHILKLAKNADITNPESMARQLLLLKEGAIVSAQLRHTQHPARDAKAVAIKLLDTSLIGQRHGV